MEVADFSGWVKGFPGLMVTMSTAGQVELFSNEILEYFGKTPEELRGWQMTDAVHPDDLSRVITAFTDSVTTGKPYRIEHRCRRADGVYRWFQVRALAVRGRDDEVTGWFVVLSDIDDIKRAEEAMRQLQLEMSHAAQIATAGELAASIAHEVNQPLSGIITNASTCLRMLDGDVPNVEGARETARRTIRDTKRASEIVARLRALFSKKEFALEPLDLSDAAREVIELYSNDLQRNGITVEDALADDLPHVMGDRIQLQQVIMNLLRNASDSMSAVEDRPRKLTVGTDRDDDSVRVTVRDTGVGLDPENVKQVFNPFFTTKDGGMGIGLSVSRSIVDSHHGRIWAAPNDDLGSTFAFSIPCAALEATRT
ncbi:MAG TPA: ATP-binding protein [Gemmatimonadaceae bacterium]|jgi:PAS domain S-box-containing protein|nr:ATP-binding protein [Gemmatimonadaceae bacterium]